MSYRNPRWGEMELDFLEQRKLMFAESVRSWAVLFPNYNWTEKALDEIELNWKSFMMAIKHISEFTTKGEEDDVAL